MNEMNSGMTRRVLIVSGADPTRAYSCIKYLYDYLRDKEIDTTVWCATPAKSLPDLLSWGNNVHSFIANRIGSVKKIGMLYMLLQGFHVVASYRNQIIVCHDYFHFRSATIVKKLFPRTILIHYCTELYSDKNKSYQRWLYKHYLKHCNEADYIIECEPMRAKYRKDQYGISKPIYTILNTLPKKEVSQYRGPRASKDCPIIVFSGGAHNEGELNILVEALSQITRPFLVKFYVYGSEENIRALNCKCDELLGDRYELISNRSREETLKDVGVADIGIVYYNPEYSVNTRYAAPTKFFEYIGLGLSVVCSANDSLISYIVTYNLGSYMNSNDVNGLRDCIEKEIAKYDVHTKERIITEFDENLCYEVQARDALRMLLSLVEKRIN